MWTAKWNEIVLTDESRFCLQHHDGRIRVWRHGVERMLNSCVVHHHTVLHRVLWYGAVLDITLALLYVRIAGTLNSQRTSPRCWSQLSFLTFRACPQPYFHRIMRDHTWHALSKGSSSIARLNCFPGLLAGSFADRKHVVHGCSKIDPDYIPSCHTRSTLATCGSCLVCWPKSEAKSIESESDAFTKIIDNDMDHLKIRSQLKNLPRRLHDLIILHCKKAESPEHTRSTLLPDFFLFPKIKTTLKGTRFKSVEAVKAKATEVLNQLTESDFQHCFQKWKSRIEQCKDRQGEYIEIKDLESENKAIVESKNIHGLKLFQQEVNERKISLNQVINTLLESELDDTQYDDYSKAKKDIFNMLVSIEEALSLIETKENTHSDKQLPESNVNLPKINLPIFNGDSANWLSFREIFNSTINSNQTLTEIQKFQYLNASVKGPAEKLIRGFPISDKNYQQAWDTLCNRFNNRRELAFSQINKIFSIRPLKSISTGSLYEILDVCNEALEISQIGEALRKEWELTLQNEEYPTFENFVNFLEKHARSLQGMRIPLFQEQKTSSKNMMAHGLYVNKGQNCILCHQIHKLNDCQRFINLPLPKKWELVKKHKLCQNCLRANHEISKCLITSRCKNCKQNHHTLLHEYNSEPSIPQPTTSQEMLISTNTICNAMPLETETNILLSTALIKVKAKDGSFVLCRALVDNGSQISLISEQCCHKLGLEKRKNSYTLKGVGDIVVNRTTSQVEIEFTPHHNDQLFSARAFVVGRVTADLPNFQIQSADFPHLENLLLADPEFYVTKPIDLILGADTFVEIILGQKTDLKHHPIALNTKLGWLVSGRIHSNIKSNTSVINHCTTELDSSIRKFWELEDVPISKAQLGIKNACEILFKSNLKRDIEGRYSVNLPFKSTPNLGDSRSQALEKGLQENPSKSEEIPSKSKKSRISKLTPQITSKQNQLLPSESSQPSTPEQPLASQSSEPLSSKKETSIIPKIKPPPYYRRKRQLPAEKTSWDEPIESDIKSNWNKFQTQLSCLKEIKIPRYLNSSSSEIEELQLHGFCDASLNAYSAVFYLKTRFKIQKIKINLITSKTKIAPLKTITIPRLELSAALLWLN
ncbi:hypothetical protein LAZ67_5004220 [Cordylochernes scorpioides]|uniref:Peptidase aspartic putative domain-containing protein n=1 Tax=Cordylochernes scorpioides TaxID=51811 RepID=A0ABY6KHV0_9ARAC|nr:hypothetical protein LAZ67_5004220 [Cordylochernes scorpioides]